MNFFNEVHIREFFDISVIMPFHKGLDQFRHVLPKNIKYFGRNGIEVILVTHNASEAEELTTLIQDHPQINWKIINPENTCQSLFKILNAGIHHAANQYVLVLDPDIELLTDMVYQLRYIVEHYPSTFTIGYTIYAHHHEEINSQNIAQLPYSASGSILMPKMDVEAIGGYNESYTAYGWGDDNIRARLELAGLRKMLVPQAVALCREDNSVVDEQRIQEKIPADISNTISHPKSFLVNDSNWGKASYQLLYDWNCDKNIAFREHLLSSFEQYHYSSSHIFEKEYKIIALVQIRNEEHFMPEVLLHVDNYCDGIILLDDGSTDGSFEKANSDKLLLKVKKTHTGYFDDLGNRNHLLKLGNLFKAGWFYFIDADERFTDAAELYSLAENDQVDTIAFGLVHLWDSKDYYRKDLPEGTDGIIQRSRMFRNKGLLQIISNREIHFPAIPYRKNFHSSNILIAHLGLLDKETRYKKYTRYLRQDEDAKKQVFSYEYLLDSDPVLNKLTDLGKGSVFFTTAPHP